MGNSDNGLSVKSRGQVKLKPAAFSVPPDSSDNQLKIAMDDIQAKAEQEQALQEAAFGAPELFKLKLDIGVLPAERKDRRTSLEARFAVGIIAAYPGDGYWKTLSLETIARNIRCSRQWAGRYVDEAKAAGYLEVDPNGKCHRYHVPEWVKYLPKTWVKPSLVRDDGLSISEAVDLSDLKFRQGDNDATWPTIQERAEVLGVSYHTIARADTSLAALGYIQRRHRPWRRSSKNEYCLTCKGQEATGVFEPKSARPKRNTLGQTIEEGNLVYANSVRNGSFRAQFGLSFSPDQDQEVHRLLRSIGTADSVARPMAFEQRYLLADVKQTLVNGALQGDDYCRRMRRLGLPAPRFNLAGYVIAALNGARRECHGVPPSKLARAVKARDKGGARAAAAGPPTEAELKQLEQYAENVLKPCLGKPPTPQESAKLAKERRLSDKKAQDTLLTRTLETARRNSRSYQKYANLGQNTGICLDKPG